MRNKILSSLTIIFSLAIIIFSLFSLTGVFEINGKFNYIMGTLGMVQIIGGINLILEKKKRDGGIAVTVGILILLVVILQGIYYK